MRHPGNRIGFAGTGAVLYQVFMAWAFGACSGDQFGDDIPLVITGKDERLFFVLAPFP